MMIQGTLQNALDVGFCAGAVFGFSVAYAPTLFRWLVKQFGGAE